VIDKLNLIIFTQHTVFADYSIISD